MKLTLDDIVEAVKFYYSVSFDDLIGESRNAMIVRARHMYFYIARKETPFSLESICSKLYRHHATVLHAVKKFDGYMTDAERNDHDRLLCYLYEQPTTPHLRALSQIGIAWRLLNNFDFNVEFNKLKNENITTP